MRKLNKLLAATVTAASIFQCMGSVPVVLAADGVPVDKSHFPDDNFRAVISSTYDLDGNGYISDYEVSRIYNIVAENKGISSIQGIEYFTEIRGLWIRQNNIATMDISKNKKLTGVWCSENKFTSLDFTPNPDMVWVYCFDCQLTSLNVRNNKHMAYIEASTNENLGSIDVSHNPELEHLLVSSCGLTELDVTHNPELAQLDCQKNNLNSLDLSKNYKMKRLDIWDNPKLGNTVKISHMKDLEYYCCMNNNVTQLDVSNNTHLMKLNCGHNKLKSLDLSHNPDLAWLQCGVNEISSLDLSNNPKLYYCLCYTNPFTTLNIGNNSRLQKVYKDGVYADEPTVCQGYSMTLDYGGSHEYFDELEYCLCVDYKCKVDTTHVKGSESYDSYLDTNDGLSDSADMVTRKVAIATLYEMAGKPGVGGLKTRFTDVGSSEWYADAVKWGEANDICFGYPNICSDTFKPDEYITREDLALMIHRFAEYKGYSSAYDYGRTDNFADFTKIDYYAWGAFTFAIQWEILRSNGDYTFPHGRVECEEFEMGLDTLFELNGAPKNAYIVKGPGSSSGSGSTTSTLPRVSTDYCAHVQGIGWQGYVYDGVTAGTSGRGLRIEAFTLYLENGGQDLGVRYRSHVQGIGWQSWVSDKQVSGTTGQSRRVEAIQIELTGSAASKYDIYYRVHVQNKGWMAWVKNGATAGTTGQGLRMEAMQIKVVPKGNKPNYVTYNAHVQGIGWQSNVADGLPAGTSGQGLRLEAIHINIEGLENVNVEYRTHIQNYGWEKTWVKNGAMSGTTGKGLRLEAIEIRLSGKNADKYDIYYRTHVRIFGWTDWAKNGESCGSAGYGYRMEAIEIIILPKANPAPGKTAKPFYQK